MLYHKLFITERRLKNAREKVDHKLEALEKIKGYLDMVDQRIEVVSTVTAMELEVLLIELKGSDLTAVEHELVMEIITNEN